MDTQHIHVTLLLLFWTYKSSAQITLTADLATVKSLQNNDISLTCITSGVSAPVMQWKLPNGAIHGKISKFSVVGLDNGEEGPCPQT